MSIQPYVIILSLHLYRVTVYTYQNHYNLTATVNCLGKINVYGLKSIQIVQRCKKTGTRGMHMAKIVSDGSTLQSVGYYN